MATVFQLRKKENLEGKKFLIFHKHTSRDEFLMPTAEIYYFNLSDVPEESKSKEKSYGSAMMERLTRGESGRVDHVLQVSFLFLC